MTVTDVPDLYPSEPLTVRFLNTVWADRDGVHDSLGSVAQLQRWAEQCGVQPSSGLTRTQLEQARSLRDALRRLAAAQLGDDRPGVVSDSLTTPQALDVLNGVLATCIAEVQVDPGSGLRRDWRADLAGFDRVLGEIALEASELLTDDPAGLGACHGPGCVLYFQKTVRRAWCSAGCGNRARVARHYRRHGGRAAGRGAGEPR